MLTGRVAFHSISKDDSPESVMSRIKGGEFKLTGSVWANVSDEAKSITSGLLTVDPKKRLQIIDLLGNSWVCISFSNVISICQII